jgi:uncharacterized membrane protein YbaN (DUF454 family)
MQDNVNEEMEVTPIKIFGIILPSLPTLMFKFSWNFLRFKRNAKKAGKVFRKELVKQGLDKQTASELTELYMKSSQIKNYIQTLR